MATKLKKKVLKKIFSLMAPLPQNFFLRLPLGFGVVRTPLHLKDIN